MLKFRCSHLILSFPTHSPHSYRFDNSPLAFPNCSVPIALSFPSHSPLLSVPVSPIPLFQFPSPGSSFPNSLVPSPSRFLSFPHSHVPSHSRFLLLSPPATCFGNAVTWQKQEQRLTESIWWPDSGTGRGCFTVKFIEIFPPRFASLC
jgi:hypothetical protein